MGSKMMIDCSTVPPPVESRDSLVLLLVHLRCGYGLYVHMPQIAYSIGDTDSESAPLLLTMHHPSFQMGLFSGL